MAWWVGLGFDYGQFIEGSNPRFTTHIPIACNAALAPATSLALCGRFGMSPEKRPAVEVNMESGCLPKARISLQNGPLSPFRTDL